VRLGSPRRLLVLCFLTLNNGPMLTRSLSCAVFPVLCWIACAAGADRPSISLPPLFADHMLLQRGMELPIWGKAAPGEKISISINASQATATANDRGEWSAKIPPLHPGDATTLTIKGADRDKPLVIEDVLVGDVWICSGQSNMEFALAGAKNGAAEVKAAKDPAIRLFQFPRVTALEPSRLVEGKWAVCTPKTAAGFSAVGYFFARDLRARENVPIGLIGNSWGGMPAESFTSAQALKSNPDFQPLLDAKRAAAPPTDAASREKLKQAKAQWEQKYILQDTGNHGFDEGFADPQTNDSDWKPMKLPGHWEDAGLKIDGAVWFRKQVQIPAAWVGKELMLRLGGIDDYDTSYFNGRQVGRTGDNGNELAVLVQREYTIPAALVKAGRATLAVRVFDRMGTGGFYGPPERMDLAPKGDESAEPISLAGDWRYRIERGVDQPEKIPPRPMPPAGESAPQLASNIFNAMVNPLIPYAIKGVIWYQGESNAGRAEQYRTLFPAMIADWRKHWGQGDFPFLFVQLANFQPRQPNPTDSAWAELREAQLMTLTKSPQTAMAVTIDIGEEKDIHPKNKQDVGKRLALAAENVAYHHDDVEFSGPIYHAMQVEGRSIRIRFDHARGLKTSDGAPPSGFAIAGADLKFAWADARIDGDSVIVSAKSIDQPIAVRYAWADTPDVNLYNSDDLPASPFRTDDWKMVTAGKNRPD
jgi:sialate O-acetylesterase